MWYYFECYGEQMGLFQVMRESVIGGLSRVRVTAKDNKWAYIFSMISHEKNRRQICRFSFIKYFKFQTIFYLRRSKYMIILIEMSHQILSSDEYGQPSQVRSTIVSSFSSTDAHANKLHGIAVVSFRLNLTTSRNLEKPKNWGREPTMVSFVPAHDWWIRIKSH